MRFLVRLGESATTAAQVIRAVRSRPGTSWWPDAISYGDVDLSHATGHRQITDSYLVALARSRDGVLATFDQGLARTFGGEVLLVP